MPANQNPPVAAAGRAGDPAPTKGRNWVEIGELCWTFSWRFCVLLLILLAIIALAWVGVKAQFSTQDLADGGIMRGIVTGLVLVVTLVLVVILVLNTCFAAGINEVEKRVSLSREVLTPLVGILGTVVGFYFGEAGKTKSPPPTVQSQLVSPPESKTTSGSPAAPVRLAPPNGDQADRS